jgi:MFS family permease
LGRKGGAAALMGEGLPVTERAERRQVGATGRPQSHTGLTRSLAALQSRDYLLFWSGMTVSMVGMWMQALATNWVVLAQITKSAAALGWINFASALPMLVLSLFGGVAADRRDKRRILFVTQTVLMLLAFLFAVLVASGHLRLWHVLLMSVLGGVAAAYDMPAFQAYYPTLVKREDLAQAIALNQASFHGSRLIGPALGGLAIQWWGASSAFVANGLSFVAVLVALILIRARPGPAESGRGSTFAAMAEGLRFVRQDVRLQSLMGITALTTLLVFPNIAVLLPLYAQVVLHMGPGGMGGLMAASGLGALVGAVALLGIAPRARVQRIALGMGAIPVGLTVLAHSHLFWLSAAAVAVQSVGLATAMGLVATILQQSVPDHLRGRVMSVHGMMFVGIMPFAALLVPGIADRLGLPRELQIAAIFYALVGAVLLVRLKGAPADDKKV